MCATVYVSLRGGGRGGSFPFFGVFIHCEALCANSMY